MNKPKYHIGQPIIKVDGEKLIQLAVVGAEYTEKDGWIYFANDGQSKNTVYNVVEPEVAFYFNINTGEWQEGKSSFRVRTA